MPGTYGRSSMQQAIDLTNVLFCAPVSGTDVVVEPNQQIIRVTIPGSSVGNLVMPAAELTAGMIFQIIALNTGGGAVKVEASDGSTDLVGDNLTAAADKVVLISDGFGYNLLLDVTT